jgi:hypothetical protein
MIHEATRAPDGSGGVIKGAAITRAAAEQRRQQGLHIVVCGPDELTNRLEAADIEATVGPWTHHTSHLKSAGPKALPHFQQRRKAHGGHSFYETTNRKAL